MLDEGGLPMRRLLPLLLCLMLISLPAAAQEIMTEEGSLPASCVPASLLDTEGSVLSA